MVLSHALVEGGTLFQVPGGHLENIARAHRPARSSGPGPRLGACLRLWLTWTLNWEKCAIPVQRIRHMSGTARMGPKGATGTCLDPSSQVQGVRGLGVMDMSVARLMTKSVLIRLLDQSLSLNSCAIISAHTQVIPSLIGGMEAGR